MRRCCCCFCFLRRARWKSLRSIARSAKSARCSNRRRRSRRCPAGRQRTGDRSRKIELGQRVLVKPGEAFRDGRRCRQGRSASDESALTGEATPVEKGVGDQVFSGTINLWGSVEFDVARLPSESTLQKIIRLIQTAQKLKAPSERFTDKFGTGYTYAVIGGSFADVPGVVARVRVCRRSTTRRNAFGLLSRDDVDGRGEPMCIGACRFHPRSSRRSPGARGMASCFAAVRRLKNWRTSIPSRWTRPER